MAPIIIDNEVKLQALLAQIAERVKEEDLLLFVDLEGVNLSRHGTVAIMQLLMPPNPVVYLIDIHVLGAKAFEVTMDDNSNLKSVLESKTTFKVFFDVRNDSDALHAHFGINLAGVIDLQVIEYATRQPRGKFVKGLARCIEWDLPYTPGWSLIKANGRRLFAPEAGGKYEVFLERPMAADIVKYCEQDVVLMPQLLAHYGPKLIAGVAAQIQAIVDDRLRLSKTATFNGTGSHMAIGPHLAAARDYKNMSISPEVGLICSARLGPLCRLDHSLYDALSGQFDASQIKQEPVKVSDSSTFDFNITPSESAESTANTGNMLAASTAGTSPEPTAGDNEGGGNEDGDSDYDNEDEQGERWGNRGSPSRSYSGPEWDDFEPDYTACSASDCGYCGRCRY